MSRKKLVLLSALSIGIASPVFAAVSADEAKALGGPVLTEFGAERAGNKDGTIPAYDPKPIKPPAGWDFKKQGYPDPWNEKPLFSITAQNAAQYADKLDGMIELFKKYPNYRMDIYPSHRTKSYPKYVIDNTVKNAAACKGADDDLKLEGCYYGGLPFPIPKTGRQEMWNHVLTYMTASPVADNLTTWVTPASGVPVLQVGMYLKTQFPFYDPAKAGKIAPSQADYFQVRSDYHAPARAAGQKLVFMFSLDTLGKGSRIYQYVPGQRRVKLAPDLAYDTPSPAGGGTSTMDDQTGFIGALDRFDFKLIGKKEKYIVYNNFMATDPRVCPDSKQAATKNFFNPDCARWELHRVWKVEATLKPGFRHIYKRRVFYWDEDTHGAGSAENYDASGKLYRLTTMIHYPFFNDEGSDSHGFWITDLNTGIWGMSTATGEGAWHPAKIENDVFFSPEALAGEGIR